MSEILLFMSSLCLCFFSGHEDGIIRGSSDRKQQDDSVTGMCVCVCESLLKVNTGGDRHGRKDWRDAQLVTEIRRINRK